MLLSRGLWLSLRLGVRGVWLALRHFGQWLLAPEGAAFVSALALMGMIGLLIAASSTLEQINQSRQVADGALSAPPERVDPVMVRIGDQYLRLSDLREYAVQANLLDPEAPLSVAEAFERDLVSGAVDQFLLVEAARREDMTLEPDVRTKLRIARGRILAATFLDRQIEAQVSDKLVGEFYRRQKQSFALGTQYVLEMLIAPDQASANSLAAAIKSGSSFKAAANSSPATIRYRGHYEFFPDKPNSGSGDKALASIVSSLSRSQISAPFQTKEGWAIVRIKAKTELTPPKFSELEPQIREFLSLDVVEKTIAQLRAAADVEIFTPQTDVLMDETLLEEPPVEEKAVIAPSSSPDGSE